MCQSIGISLFYDSNIIIDLKCLGWPVIRKVLGPQLNLIHWNKIKVCIYFSLSHSHYLLFIIRRRKERKKEEKLNNKRLFFKFKISAFECFFSPIIEFFDLLIIQFVPVRASFSLTKKSIKKNRYKIQKVRKKLYIIKTYVNDESSRLTL